MANPVQERVMVFFFKELKEDAVEALRLSFEGFLKDHFGVERFAMKRINQPVVTRPKRTEGDVEPDWSKLKVGLDRFYRYETSDGLFMFQLSKEFFSLNVLNGDDEVKGAGSSDDLLGFYESLKAFVLEQLSRRIKIEEAHYDVIYRLGQDLLKDFLERRRPDGSYGYYNVFKLFKNLGEGSQQDEWGLVSPLRQRICFNKRRDAKKQGVEVDIEAGLDRSKGWYLQVKTASSSELLNLHGESVDKIELMFKFLPDFECSQMTVLRRTFSDQAMKILGCR